jgi:hypothetical protein
VQRLHQAMLIATVLLCCWLGMQAVHEFGHVVGAWLTGGVVARVVLYPLTISRTDLLDNPSPTVVVWTGPVLGVLLPVVFWGAAAAIGFPGAFVLRFFAGFCLIANGAYIAGGSFDGIGDCGQMLRHGSPIWTLWLFGAVAVPVGLMLWHRQGVHFGLGPARGKVGVGVAYTSLAAAIVLTVLGFVLGRE